MKFFDPLRIHEPSPCFSATVRMVRASDPLDGQRVPDVVEPRAAELRRHGHAEEAELAHARDDLARPARRAIELGGPGLDLALREIARCLLDERLLFGEVEVHAGS